jgi:SAM-dependent methyltransferase
MDYIQALDRYLAILAERRIVPSVQSFDRHCRALFKGEELSGRAVLDVGGGFGLYSFYLWCQGAASVTCLEPEGMGSRSDVKAVFDTLRTSLDCRDVQLKGATLQDFHAADSYDLVLLHNSINHLDEPACASLLQSTSSRTIYLGLAKKLFDLCAENGTLLVADCSRHNFFHMVGLRNPFVSSIEWEKHQHPAVWRSLLVDAGFSDVDVRWYASDSLRGGAQRLLSNAAGAFLTTSRFVIRGVKAACERPLCT